MQFFENRWCTMLDKFIWQANYTHINIFATMTFQ